MVKWPKKWLKASDAVNVNINPGDPWFTKRPEYILDELHELGALRDPPKSREFWVCYSCQEPKYIYHAKRECCTNCLSKDLVHVREVLE